MCLFILFRLFFVSSCLVGSYTWALRESMGSFRLLIKDRTKRKRKHRIQREANKEKKRSEKERTGVWKNDLLPCAPLYFFLPECSSLSLSLFISLSITLSFRIFFLFFPILSASLYVSLTQHLSPFF